MADTTVFAQKLLKANSKVKVEIIPKVSHAYMQVLSILPEAQYANKLSIQWFKEILNDLKIKKINNKRKKIDQRYK